MSTATIPRLAIRREPLVDALGAMVAARRTTLPVLQAVLMETTEGGLRLTSTDFDVWSVVTVACEAEPGLRALIPHDTLSQAVGRMKADLLRVEIEGCGVTLDGSVRILGMDPDEFPELRAVEAEAWTVEGLAEALREAAPYTSSETARPTLNGIYVDTERSRVVALDGHKVIVRDLPGAKGGAPILLPKSVPSALAHMGETLSVRSDGRHARFDSDAGTVYARLVEGNYPDWTRVTPEPEGTVVTCDAAELGRLVALAETVSNRSHALGGSFVATVTDGSVRIHSEHADTGHADLTLEAEIDGKDIETSWGCKYVTQALKALGGERVRIAMDAPERITKWTNPEDDTRAIWIMPRRML